MSSSPDAAKQECEDLNGSQLALRDRIKRFAVLRSAHRALASSTSREQDEVDELAAGLRRDLAGTSKIEGNPDAVARAIREALPSIDEQIDQIERKLQAAVDGIGLAQLRSTMPELDESHRHELVAVLDLLLGDRDKLLHNLCKVEYLITLLSSERDHDRDRRRVTNDPVEVSEVLARLCLELEADAPANAADIELEFFQAAALDDDQGDSKPALRRMRQRKLELGLHCLLPRILRALVTYNTRMFNRIQADMDAARSTDAEFDALFPDLAADPNESGPEAGEPDCDLGQGAEEQPEPGTGAGVLECDALALITDVVGRRLHGESIGGKTCDRVGLSFDLFDLQDLERQALDDPEIPANGELIARTVIVGGLNRDFPAFREALLELGIAEDQVRRTWVQELDERLRELISSKIAAVDQYEEASDLSNLKARHLFTPLTLIAKQERAERGPSRRPSRGTGNEHQATMEIRDVSEAAAAQAGFGRIEMHSTESAETSHGPDGDTHPAGKTLRIAAGILVAATCAVALINWIEHAPSEIETLRTIKLEYISPYLTAAYRDQQGKGTQFFGRIDRDWMTMTAERKHATALEMVNYLKQQGVTQIMVYDERLHLQIHFAGNQLRLPPLGSK